MRSSKSAWARWNGMPRRQRIVIAALIVIVVAMAYFHGTWGSYGLPLHL